MYHKLCSISVFTPFMRSISAVGFAIFIATTAFAAAVFPSPRGLVFDSLGNLYVSDGANSAIYKVSMDLELSSVFAGSPGSLGSVDGDGATARFRTPNGLAIDASGNIYVADTGNSTIRKITPAGVVTTLAGVAISTGSIDGIGAAAQFSLPQDVCVDASGVLFVADSGNHTIRQITALGSVTTSAGSHGIQGHADGTGSIARFNTPSGIAIGSAGLLYVADTNNNTLRVVNPTTGVVSTLVGTYGVTGATDGSGLAATFNGPTGTTVDGTGAIYVADTANSVIRKITAAGVVTTLAGLSGITGAQDGMGTGALFNHPRDVVVDSSGNVYVADTGNSAIRKITPHGVVTTLIITEQLSGGGQVGSSGASSSSSSSSGGSPNSSGGGGAPSTWFLMLIAAFASTRFAITLLRKR